MPLGKFIGRAGRGSGFPVADVTDEGGQHVGVDGTGQAGAPGDGLNNLVVLNYDAPTPLGSANVPGHFCYAFDARHVETVISQGKVIVDHGALSSMDEADILAYANEQARRLWALL